LSQGPYRYCAWSGDPDDEGSEVLADGCGFGAIGTWILEHAIVSQPNLAFVFYLPSILSFYLGKRKIGEEREGAISIKMGGKGEGTDG
jgi:hypothetical protein